MFIDIITLKENKSNLHYYSINNVVVISVDRMADNSQNQKYVIMYYDRINKQAAKKCYFSKSIFSR